MIKPAVCLLLLAAPLGAQSAPKADAAGPVVSDVRSQWRQAADYVARSAAAMPESSYAFRPAPSVRTFGQIIGHVAGSQYMFCAMALGEKVPPEDEIEKTRTTKGALIEALTQSTEYCQRAYAQSDASVGGVVDVFGNKGSRRSVLIMNANHDAEHYGNLITYMRIKGLVPPSSQR